MEKLLVAGFGTYDDGSVFVILKDKVSKNANLRLVKATKTGSVALAKGITIEKAHQIMPLGTDMSADVQFGDEVPSEYGGIYAVVERVAKKSEE